MEFNPDGIVVEETGRLRLFLGLSSNFFDTIENTRAIFNWPTRADVIQQSLRLMRYVLNKLSQDPDIEMAWYDRKTNTAETIDWHDFDGYVTKRLSVSDREVVISEPREEFYQDDYADKQLQLDFDIVDVDVIDKLSPFNNSRSRSEFIAKSFLFFEYSMPAFIDGKEVITSKKDGTIVAAEFDWAARLRLLALNERADQSSELTDLIP